MSDEKRSKPLATTEFTPLGSAGARRRFRVSPIYISLGVVATLAGQVQAIHLIHANLWPGWVPGKHLSIFIQSRKAINIALSTKDNKQDTHH